MKSKAHLIFIALSCALALMLIVPTSFAGGKGDNAEKATKERADMNQGHDEIDVDDLPAPIRTAVEQKYPNSDIEEVVRVNEGNAEVYRVKVEDESNIERFLIYNPSGNLIETNESVDKEQLPESVQATIAREFPESDIEECDKITKGNTTTWEVVLEEGGQETLVTFDNTGNRISSKPFIEDREDRNIGKDKEKSGY